MLKVPNTQPHLGQVSNAYYCTMLVGPKEITSSVFAIAYLSWVGKNAIIVLKPTNTIVHGQPTDETFRLGI